MKPKQIQPKMKKNKDIEIRNLDSKFEVKDEIGEVPRVEGRAIVFNSPSKYMGWIETVKPEAITQELINNSDVFCRVNHSDDYIVARSINGEGHLKLELREDGLYYSFDVPNTEKGRELVEHIKRKEIFTSSFAFIVDKEGDEWHKEADGVIYRDIHKIKGIFDVAPVYTAAYAATSCSSRAENMCKYFDEIEKKLALLEAENEAL